MENKRKNKLYVVSNINTFDVTIGPQSSKGPDNNSLRQVVPR